jgi:hypothetical protein
MQCMRCLEAAGKGAPGCERTDRKRICGAQPGRDEANVPGRASAAMVALAARTSSLAGGTAGRLWGERKGSGADPTRGRRCCYRLFTSDDCPHDRISQNRCPATSSLSHRLVPVEDYLKPKVFLVRPSTHVMALSEKNVDAYNSASLPHIPACLTPKAGVRAIIRQHSRPELPCAFDG